MISLEIFSLKRTWAVLLAIVTLLGIGGAVITIDDRYCLASDFQKAVVTLEQINQRLDQQIVNDRRVSFQQRIYALEDRYRGQQMPESVISELSFLRAELAKLEAEQ